MINKFKEGLNYVIVTRCAGLFAIALIAFRRSPRQGNTFFRKKYSKTPRLDLLLHR